MNAFIVIALCLLSGLLLRRVKVFPENTSFVLNQYVIWVALPALIIYQVPRIELSFSALMPMAFAWGLLIISASFVWLVSQWMQWSNQTRCVLLLLVPLGNTSFVGIPMVNALLGESAIPFAILYDQFGSFLALASYGAIVLSVYCGDKVSGSSIAKKVITFPPFIALAVAFVLAALKIDNSVLLPFKTIGYTLVPVVMVAVGFQWQLSLSKSVLSPMLMGLTIKLILAPLMAFAVMQALQVDDLAGNTIILEAAMAPMISAGALAMSHQQNIKLASAMVGYGLLLSFFTVPLWHWFLV